MYIFRVQIIIVLLLIGKQRSEANNSALEAQSAETSKEHDSPQDGREEKAPARHWDCQPDSQYIQEQISLTTKMLQAGDEFIKRQKSLSADETVLVVGKAGSGKTSLVQFLINNNKLLSKEINTNTGEYIFEDGEKIGTSPTESFTLYPEVGNYNSTIYFCDSPGFHDSRSSAHEIVSMNVMRTITNKFKRAKILLVENHASLQYGVAKDSFIKTLRFVNDFIVDIDKYKDHIAIIATKIPLTYRVTSDDITIVSGIVTDEMLVESIVSYLNHTEKSLTERLKFKKSQNEEDFHRKVIRLLGSLQTRDENGKATRVNIFRRPHMSGNPQSMPLLVKNRESLLQTVMDLTSVEVRQNDFDYTLSNAAKIYLECILKLSSDNYKNKINELSFKLTDYIRHKTQNYTSFHKLLSELISLHESLKQLSQNLEKTNNHNEFFKMMHGFLSDHKIPLQENYNERIHVLEKYEEMLLKFVDMSRIFIPSSWTVPIRQVIKNVEDEVGWYQTLNKLIEGLRGYETQKNKSEIYRKVFHENSTSTNNLMTLFMSVTESTDLEQFMEARGNARKSREMELITSSLLKESKIVCDSNGRLIVKGFVVRLSEINSENLVHIYCKDIKLKEVALLAVDTVYLDEDTVDMFKGVNMFIAAPKWEVIGQRKIVLSGQPGLEVSGDVYAGNGIDGRPGLPGGNGGSFYGIGLQFLNGGNLRIELNGSRGGRGTDGGKGDKGEDGKDGVQKAIEAMESSKPITELFSTWHGYESRNLTRDILIDNAGGAIATILFKDNNICGDDEISRTGRASKEQFVEVHAGIDLYRYEGDCGKTGGRGGLGGKGGIGGIPGEQRLIELGDSSGINFERSNGSNGEHGNVGEFGDRGLNGIAVTCYRLMGLTWLSAERVSSAAKAKSYWKCFNSDTSLVSCGKEPTLNGTLKYSTTGMKEPTPLNSFDFCYYQYNYEFLLHNQRDNPVFHKIITDFRNKKHSLNLNESFC